jgi:cysteate synthase
MLNITGGGIEKFKRENPVSYLEPEKVFPLGADPAVVKEEILKMFS